MSIMWLAFTFPAFALFSWLAVRAWQYARDDFLSDVRDAEGKAKWLQGIDDLETTAALAQTLARGLMTGLALLFGALFVYGMLGA